MPCGGTHQLVPTERTTVSPERSRWQAVCVSHRICFYLEFPISQPLLSVSYVPGVGVAERSLTQLCLQETHGPELTGEADGSSTVGPRPKRCLAPRCL